MPPSSPPPASPPPTPKSVVPSTFSAPAKPNPSPKNHEPPTQPPRRRPPPLRAWSAHHRCRARTWPSTRSQIAKLASNENPLGPSPRALQAIRDSPRTSPTSILTAPANRPPTKPSPHAHGLTPDHVVLGCGSNEIIEFCYHAYTQPGQGRKVLASAYAFAVYGLMARLFAVPFEEVPDRNFPSRPRRIFRPPYQD